MALPTPRPFVFDVSLERGGVPSFDEYPFSLPAVRGLHRLEFHPGVTFFAGENGSGKSTLLEAVAVAMGFNPEGGSRNHRFSTTPESHSPLFRHVRIGRGARRPGDGFFLRTESFFNLATAVDRLDRDTEAERARIAADYPGLQLAGLAGDLVRAYGGRSLHAQSHGESLLSLFLHRLGGTGLYLLDEPETALSPLRQMSLLSLMHRMVRTGSQFIVATHSPILLAYPRARIYLFGEGGITETEYEETEAYRVTHDFLRNRHAALAELFADDD